MKLSEVASAAAAAIFGAMAVFGCGSDSGGGTTVVPPPPPPAVTAPGSGLFAIDCARQLAYVPLDTLDNNGNGQVAVINLAVDPDTTDPRVTIVHLTHPDIPTGTALDNDDSQIIVVSGKTSGQDGKVDLIDENTNTLVAGSPFAFPAGSQAGYFGQVLYNPATHQAVVATCDSATCSSGNAATGFALFDPVAHTFGAIIPANYAETFALNSKTNTVIDASDDDNSGEIGAVDVPGARACTLSDTNIGDDNDGSSFDSTTNIVVVSNESDNATVINLKGSAFNPASGTPCTLVEGGTPPNSVLVGGLPNGTAGSAVDPTTHQAFLISDGGNGVALLQLPKKPVTQIQPANITSESSMLSNDPLGSAWGSKGDPYAVAVAACKAIPPSGFAINDNFTFLVKVSLADFKNNPANISIAPPAGNCAGTTTTVTKCDNGNGVTFYPLPGVN